MSYTVTWHRPAVRAMSEDLPLEVALAVNALAIGDLAANPRRVGKALRPPFGDLFSARRGDYRVVYRIDEDATILRIFDVRHRRDAYRSP